MCQKPLRNHSVFHPPDARSEYETFLANTVIKQVYDSQTARCFTPDTVIKYGCSSIYRLSEKSLQINRRSLFAILGWMAVLYNVWYSLFVLCIFIERLPLPYCFHSNCKWQWWYIIVHRATACVPKKSKSSHGRQRRQAKEGSTFFLGSTCSNRGCALCTNAFLSVFVILCASLNETCYPGKQSTFAQSIFLLGEMNLSFCKHHQEVKNIDSEKQLPFISLKTIFWII